MGERDRPASDALATSIMNTAALGSASAYSGRRCSAPTRPGIAD